MAIYIYLVLGSVLVASTMASNNDSSIANQKCMHLKDKTSTENLDIFVAGLVNKRFLLVTKDFMIYDLPRESVDDSTNRIHLNGQPMPMAEKWPALWKFKTFNTVVNSTVFNVVTVSDIKGSYFCITTKYDVIQIAGPCYSLSEKRAFNGFTYYGHDDQVLITTNRRGVFYACHRMNGNFQMSKFSFGNKKLEDMPNINQMFPWLNICLGDKIIFTSNKFCDKPFGIPIRNGFSDGKQFYLFAFNQVVIFSEKTLEQYGHMSAVQFVSYKNFIACNQTSLLKGSNIAIYIGAAIATLILLLCCILFVSRRLNQNSSKLKSKSKKSKSKNEVKSKKSKNAISKTNSNLSSNYSSSKQNSKSVRSFNSLAKICQLSSQPTSLKAPSTAKFKKSRRLKALGSNIARTSSRKSKALNSSSKFSKPSSSKLVRSPSKASKPASSRLVQSSLKASKPSSSKLVRSPSKVSKPASSRLVQSSLKVSKPTSSRLVRSSSKVSKPASSKLVRSSSKVSKPTSSRLNSSRKLKASSSTFGKSSSRGLNPNSSSKLKRSTSQGMKRATSSPSKRMKNSSCSAIASRSKRLRLKTNSSRLTPSVKRPSPSVSRKQK